MSDRVCADGTLLAVGSHDNFIYVYSVADQGRKYSRYGKCSVSREAAALRRLSLALTTCLPWPFEGIQIPQSASFQGHSSYITHLDWSPDNNFIMSNSGDYEILYCQCARVVARSRYSGGVCVRAR